MTVKTLTRAEMQAATQEYHARFKPATPVYRARLGNGAGVVAVSGRVRYVYARIRDDSQVRQVLNKKVEAADELEVTLGYLDDEPGILQVLGISTSTIVGDDGSLSGIQAHGQSHAWGNYDPVFIDQRQTTYGYLRANSPASMALNVDELWYVGTSGAITRFIATSTASLAAYVPTTPGQAAWVCVTVNSLGALVYTSGSAFNSFYSPDIYAQMPTPPAGIVLGDVILKYGATGITQSDIDGRRRSWLLGTPTGSGAVTGSGSAGQVAYWDSGTSLDGDTGLTYDAATKKTGVDSLQFSLTPTSASAAEGFAYWDVDEGTLNLGMPGGNVNLQIGQEMLIRAYNDTGADMVNGQLVYISGGTGNRPLITLARANAETTSAATVGMTTEAIADHHYGYVTTTGLVRDVNTAGSAAGTLLYLSPTVAGGYTATKPTAPNHLVSIGVIVRSHLTEGVIYLSINNGLELEELHDVSITSASPGDLLQVNAAGLWSNTNLLSVTKDPTGFYDPANVTETYDPVTRTITITGSGSAAYWRGLPVVFSSGSSWTSGSHADTNGVYYLSYDGVSASWSTSPWTLDKLQIAYANYSGSAGNSFAIRECHGLMPWQAHEEFHETIGCYRESGGTLTWTAGSAGRKPSVSACVIHDEDCVTTNGSAAGGNFTLMYLSGSGATPTAFLTAQADITQVTGNAPKYNSLSGATWGQTACTAVNPYMSVWLMAIPATASAQSQKFRFVWVQGQSAGTLASQQALTPANLNLGNFAALATEFVFLAQVIIKYDSAGGGSWAIDSVVNITGNRYNQTAAPAGLFLSAVNATYPLQGYGTSADPLTLAAATTGSAGSMSAADKLKLDQFVNGGYTLTVPASGSAVLGSGSNYRVAIWIGIPSSLTYDNSIVWDNTNKRLGIAQPSPLHPLDVVGNIRSSGVINANIRVEDGTVYTKIQSITTSSPNFGLLGTESNHACVLVTNNTERMRITETGNVGIGTATPEGKLHVIDTLRVGPSSIGTDSIAGIYFQGTPSSTSNYSIHRTNGSWDAPNYQQLLLDWDTGIVIDGGSTYGKSGTVLQPNGGNVGIGTTSPGYTLEVNGTINAVTAYRANGTLGATANVAVAKVGGGTRTLSFNMGLYTGYTDS